MKRSRRFKCFAGGIYLAIAFLLFDQFGQFAVHARNLSSNDRGGIFLLRISCEFFCFSLKHAEQSLVEVVDVIVHRAYFLDRLRRGCCGWGPAAWLICNRRS